MQRHDQSKIKRRTQTERGSVSKLRQIRDLIQTNFVPEGNSAATDGRPSLDNGPHPGTSEQTGGTQPAGQGERENTQHRDAIWNSPHRVIIIRN